MRSHVETYGVVKFDANGRIARELPCPSCGQNLRGLSTDGRCPECGEPVADATRAGARPRSWRPALLILGASTLFAVTAIVLHGIYLARHAARTAPIDLFHNLSLLCSLAVLTCCIAAGVRTLRSRALPDLAAFIACLPLSVTSLAVAAQTV